MEERQTKRETERAEWAAETRDAIKVDRVIRGKEGKEKKWRERVTEREREKRKKEMERDEKKRTAMKIGQQPF